MLVLTRKLSERIVIGDNITITIVKVEGNKVRVGIDAPADVVIYRQELVELDENGTRESLAIC